jgi:hypothetical protein
LSNLGAARGDPGLVFRGRALGGKALLLGLALLAQDQFLSMPAPGRRNALSQFRHELAGQGAPDQATQVGHRAGMHRVFACIRALSSSSKAWACERAALNQDKRRLPFFGEQGFRQNQITTTLRISLARDGLPCEWLLY